MLRYDLPATFRRGLALRGAAALAAAALLLAGCTAASSRTTTAPAPRTATATRPAAAVSSAAAAARAQRSRADARAALAKVVASTPHHAAGVAAVDLTTGRSLVEGSRRPMWTASMYKLLVLETLLREQGALGGPLLDQARTMIENSDNKAGYALWEDGGANAGLGTTMKKLSMTRSEADGTDPTFTRVTPADAVRMVRALAVPNDVIRPAAQRQALDLMRNVESDQRWGVGVVADRGTHFANKNGWLSIGNDNGPGEDDGGRWAVTSAGAVTVHGHRVLLAAMTEHEPSMGAGVHDVQSMSRSAVSLLGL